MVTLAGSEADDKNCIRSLINASDCIVTTGHWKLNRFCGLVKLPIGYAHVPYKFVNFGNVLLEGIYREHDATAPWSAKLLNSSVLK